MFGMSFLEIAVILVLILVVFGPEKIPEVARTAGKVMREVRKASNLLRDALEVEEDRQQRRSPVAKRKVTGAVAGATGASMAELDALGPLDQLDDEHMGLDGVDPFAVGWREPERVEVPLAARVIVGDEQAREIALQVPRLDPILAHAEQEQVALHDQLIEEWQG